jgi:hypothetical protein
MQMNHNGARLEWGRRAWEKLGRVLALFGLLAAVMNNPAAEVSMTAHQVKALFLLNFTRYVDWPIGSFAEANAPFTIGLYGGGSFGEVLKRTVEGKTVAGRRIAVELIDARGAPEKCQILFIGESERKSVAEILKKVKSFPVLTVGETDQFLDQGGVINFVKKDDRVRLEVNLDAALEAKLQISAKLLNVADSVKGSAK